MNWNIISFENNQVLVQFEDGQQFNINISAAVAAADPDRPEQLQNPLPGVIPLVCSPSAVMVPCYLFKPDANTPVVTLAEHAHDSTASLHSIEVVAGTVTVKKDSGDVVATAGQRVEIAVGEKHSVVASEYARTVHWPVGSQ